MTYDQFRIEYSTLVEISIIECDPISHGSTLRQKIALEHPEFAAAFWLYADNPTNREHNEPN